MLATSRPGTAVAAPHPTVVPKLPMKRQLVAPSAAQAGGSPPPMTPDMQEAMKKAMSDPAMAEKLKAVQKAMEQPEMQQQMQQVGWYRL